MPLKINENPRFTNVLVKAGCFENQEMTFVDVGASGGHPSYMDLFGNHVKIIGFEPNLEQFREIKQTTCKRAFPIGLGRRKEQKPISITRWPYSSSSIPFNKEFWKRFPNSYMFDLVRIETFETVDFDSFCIENKIECVDFMKIDTEGSELDILEGSENILEKEAIAILVEVAFYPYQTGRPLFADIDIFLRRHGFTLYDLETVRLARSALPPLNTYIADPSSYGQMLAGDALYLRDFVSDSCRATQVHPSKLLKTVCLFEIFSLNDCAIELLEYSIQNRFIPKEFSNIIDNLVPKVFNRYLSLENHRNIYNNLPQLI
jgi:FkbM family methyltransferase